MVGLSVIIPLILAATGTVGAFYIGQGNQDQEIAVLETEVVNTKDDVTEIKSDIKEILRILNEK